MLKDLTIPNCHGLRMPRSRNMPIPKATSGPFCSRFDPHKTKMEEQAATDRSVDIEGRGCKSVSGNCCKQPLHLSDRFANRWSESQRMRREEARGNRDAE